MLFCVGYYSCSKCTTIYYPDITPHHKTKPFSIVFPCLSCPPPNFLLTKHIFLSYKGNSYYTELKKKKTGNIAKQSNFIIFFLLSQKGIYIKVIILLETSRVTIIETELVGRGKAGKYKKYIFFQLGERLKMVQVIAYIWDFSIRAGMKSIVQRFTSLVLFYKFVKIYLVVNEARHLQYTRIIC